MTPESTPTRQLISIGKPLRLLLFTLILPVTVAVSLDLATGLLPLLTIFASVICIPLSTFLVNRTVLLEMDRVFAVIAPQSETPGSEPADKAPAPVPTTAPVEDRNAGIFSQDASS